MPPTHAVRRLVTTEAGSYRTLRLAGLASDPACFGASLEEEARMPLTFFEQRLERDAVFGGWGPDGALAGVVGLSIPQAIKLRHKAVLWGLFVRPEARRTGLAAALVGLAVAHARGKVEEIRLTVAASNRAAVRLYTRLGFETYGLEPRALKLDGQYHDEMLMALPPAALRALPEA